MNCDWTRQLVLVVIFILGYCSANGSHIRAGNISITGQDCLASQYRIQLILYADLNSLVTPGEGILNFGDGTTKITTISDFVRGVNLPNQVSVYTLEIYHTFLVTNQSVLVRYEESNRNGGILNITNSSSVSFYVESGIFVSSTLCNSNPQLISPPIDVACNKVAFQHNSSPFDVDGDSLSFHLVVPKRAVNTEVDYISPDNEIFYPSNYATASEDGLNPPDINIDAISGMLVWDAPGAIGEYNIAFVINEWRKINGVYTIIGFVRRDMQIIVEQCDNRPPELLIPEDVCVYVGESIDRNIIGLDPDGHSVKIEIFSGIFSFASLPTIVPQLSEFVPPPGTTLFSWTPDCNDVRNQPYQVVIKITDNPTTGNSITRFKTWNIRVAAQAPIIKEPILDVVARSGIISWLPYTCEAISKIAIWRRVGGFDYTPEKCIPGVPEYAGYSFVGEVDPGQTSFIDTNFGQGLAPGAVYCYRITAIFPLAGGAESEVSTEVCMPPVLAEAPIITQVSVITTSVTEGSINLKWYSPYELEMSDFDEQYKYEIIRFDNELSDYFQVTNASPVDTTFLDMSLNTEAFDYSYKIVLLAKNIDNEFVPVDTSASASSVWNVTTPESSAIALSWDANVPWSNVVQANPWHLIYRQAEGTDEFILIDSVNVVNSGFVYTDKGIFNNESLLNDKFYCYKVLTRGSYGNPDIQFPLENFSQVMCSTIFDDTPPCIPIVKAELDCTVLAREWTCSQQAFTNELFFEQANLCNTDSYYYKIYTIESDQLQLLDVAYASEYSHTNLTSKTKCYRVSAVDRAGNESDLSETICFDNCPSVFFPNIFTPDGDLYNQFFTTMNQDPYCTRFVKQISLKVLNRWGQVVVELPFATSVQWDGKDSRGQDVDTGIYYFIANIEFHSSSENDRLKEVKGWLQVMK